MRKEPIANLDYLIKDIQKNRPAVVEILYGENVVYAAGCKRAGADESESADVELVINDLKGDFYETFKGCVLFYKPRRTAAETKTKAGYKFIVAFKDEEIPVAAPMMQQQQQPVYVNGVNSAPVDRDQLEEEIRSKIMFEIEKENFRKEKEQFEQSKINGTGDENDFTSTLANISGNFCKVIDSIANVMREVNKSRSISMQGQPAVGIAGVENETIPNNIIEKMEETKTTIENTANEVQDVQEHVENLLERFSNVEPQWIELLEKVVIMAENKDATYTMAKTILLK